MDNEEDLSDDDDDFNNDGEMVDNIKCGLVWTTIPTVLGASVIDATYRIDSLFSSSTDDDGGPLHVAKLTILAEEELPPPLPPLPVFVVLLVDNLLLVESITSLANGDEANNDAPDSNPPFPPLPTLESLALPLPKCSSNIRSLADFLRRSLVEEVVDVPDVVDVADDDDVFLSAAVPVVQAVAVEVASTCP